MKFCFYTNSISPHQLPLARELIKRLGADHYRYVYTTPLTEGRKKCGWGEESEPWLVKAEHGDGVADAMLESCDVLLSGMRDLDLFEKRAVRGLKTLYVGERWFKPLKIGIRDQGLGISAPGWMRMLVPSYRGMVKRFVRWVNSDPSARCLTIGPWAKKDMLRLGVPETKIIPWGYFVAPSAQSNIQTIEHSNNLKVLWVGRMLDWKRVDTIVRAVREVKVKSEDERWSVQLTLVGDGPERKRLVKMAEGLPVVFLPSQPIDKIRSIMRAHDVYVLSSDEGEGWGAALSEALEEGMVGIGTYEAGASATMLPDACLYHAGDWRRLAMLLRGAAQAKDSGALCGQGIGEWSAVRAAERLLAL